MGEVLSLFQQCLHQGAAHAGVAVSVHPVGEPRARDADLGGVAALDEGGNVRLLGKGSKPRTIRVSSDRLKLFESLGRGEPGDWLFPSNKRNGPLTRQAVAARMAMWGREANVRLHPHRCRHTHATHAIRRGVDVFTLSATLGHSSTGTTSHYVLAEPGESSSLKLG